MGKGLDMCDLIETVLHLIWTSVAWGVAHWEGIAGFILFCLQAAVLIKKLRD